jgi:hypothetical protein
MEKLDIPMTGRFLLLAHGPFLDAWTRRRPDSYALTPSGRGMTAAKPLAVAADRPTIHALNLKTRRGNVQWIMTTSGRN